MYYYHKRPNYQETIERSHFDGGKDKSMNSRYLLAIVRLPDFDAIVKHSIKSSLAYKALGLLNANCNDTRQFNKA
ncbi:hypothetical protein SAMN06296036_105111 [Pseudobacteriovorax antillogorgiicola]|uniref:Uncharacterized protein n=1 Tax=Pseudobacteriovorax antillogorgiicola TaxID=1513793 RepID=A0A1Y6BMT0_9BACT|nr:hypothetical protein EDD56_105213 [Pseudobacteriovorax antillogorgiicola]SMF11793.1 hypothetical protein SAMN06296036_105111 [Pseudobacteriovorax antillogorgiicola]